MLNSLNTFDTFDTEYLINPFCPTWPFLAPKRIKCLKNKILVNI